MKISPPQGRARIAAAAMVKCAMLRRDRSFWGFLVLLFVPERTDPSLPHQQARALWAVVLLCCIIEAIWQAQAAGLDFLPWRRSIAVQYAGFWSGLLDDWQPNYPGQPLAMFMTYGLIHADLWHLLGNMVLLLILGRRVVNKAGQGGFLLLLWGSVVAGGVGFALLADTSQPMVGLSGGLFGLVAAEQLWRRTTTRDQIYIILWLIALHLLFWFVQDGGLAWQAHLGGYVGGALMSRCLPAR